MSKFIPLPAWLPDQLELGNVLVEARNVLPYANGYAPVGSFASVSDAMPEAFQGGASFISTSGTAYLLAGGPTGLYRMASGTWSTLVNLLSITERWRFVQFANFAIAVNGAATRQIDLATATQSTIAGAPTGLDVSVIGGTNGGHVFIARPNGAKLDVAWSALNDRTGWTPGVNQSGQETMITGGEVMGLAGGRIRGHPATRTPGAGGRDGQFGRAVLVQRDNEQLRVRIDREHPAGRADCVFPV